LYPSKKEQVESLVPYTISGGTVTPASDPTDSSIAVTSVSMVISGEVAFADNSIKSYEFEIRDDNNVYNHSGEEGNEAWLALADDSTAKSLIEQIFTALYSSENDPITVTIVT